MHAIIVVQDQDTAEAELTLLTHDLHGLKMEMACSSPL
jgi:hypothetical protein